MEYIYLKTEPSLWTVGHYDPAGKFIPEKDCDSADEAARRVAWLNGGSPQEITGGAEKIQVAITEDTLEKSSGSELKDLIDALSAKIRSMVSNNDSLRAAYPRVYKLMDQKKFFIVIAKHEPYFVNAYSMIRDQEIRQGTWNYRDERMFQINTPPCTSPDFEGSVLCNGCKEHWDCPINGWKKNNDPAAKMDGK